MAAKKAKQKYSIIDAHNHPEWHKHDIKKFIANMDANKIAKAWLLTWECPTDEYAPSTNSILPATANGQYGSPIPFSLCLKYKEQEPDRFVLGYAPDPREPNAIDKLKSAVEMYGVKVYGELKVRMMYDNPDAIRMFKYCGEAGLPVTVHIDYEFNSEVSYPRPNYWYGGGIDAFERAIAKCPDTIFLGHAPGFWAHISGDKQFDKTMYPKGEVKPDGKIVKMLKKYDNLYCDISAGSGCGALQRDLNFTKDFLTEFQNRILFARDYFDSKHYELIESLKLPKKIKDKIYFKNAQKLIGE
jgi:hypothetical protein